MIELESKGMNKKDSRNTAAHRALMDAEREQSRRFEIEMTKYFSEQSRKIDSSLSGNKKDDSSVWDILMGVVSEQDGADAAWEKLSQKEKDSLVNNFVLNLIDWKEEEKILLSIFDPLWKETYKKGVDIAANLYHLNAIQKPELISTAKLRGGSRVKGIENTTKESISRIVSSGLENGDSTQMIARQIQEEMKTTAGRARTIAIQECNTSLLTGNFDMMKRSGSSTKTWHVTNPSSARPSHKKLNGVTVPIDGKFPNGLRFPCDPDCDDASEVVNCHCFLTYN